jgi:hypothetical protein
VKTSFCRRKKRPAPATAAAAAAAQKCKSSGRKQTWRVRICFMPSTPDLCGAAKKPVLIIVRARARASALCIKCGKKKERKTRDRERDARRRVIKILSTAPMLEIAAKSCMREEKRRKK